MADNKNKIEIVLKKNGEQDITVTCPKSIKLSFWQTYLVLRFDFPPLNVNPKDWKGFVLIESLFLIFLGFVVLGGIIPGIILLIVNFHLNRNYFLRFIQKKIDNGYFVAEDQIDILINAGIKLPDNFMDQYNITLEEKNAEQEIKEEVLI